MACIVEDTGGQWIVLSGLAVSLSLIAVAVLVNQAAITGYYSAYAPLEFPKEQIIELTAQTRESARSAAWLAWNISGGYNSTSNESVLSNFTSIFGNYSKQLEMIYAAHGETVNITMFNYTKINDTYTSGNISLFNSTDHSIKNTIWLNISYNDGTTRYASEPEIVEVN